MMRPLFSRTFALLQKTLDLRLQRHTILSANVANAETPGYIAKDLRFEEALRQAAHGGSATPLRRTHARHLPAAASTIDAVQGTLVAVPSNDVGGDLNTVSIDQEMEKLTVNTFHYNASAELMSRLFAQLKRVINEGRS